MKNLLILVAFLACSFNAVAAVRTPARGSSGTNASGNTTVSARAAVRGARSATTSNVAPATSGAGAGAVVQRRGAPAAATTSSGTTVGRSATPVKTTAARAAKQNVVAGGTKVASAAQNTLVDETCRQKFDGCMDSFCMMENASGGRCLCSDRNKELNTLLAQIERLDAQSYKMATEGVEKIEMGENADAVMASAKAITKSLDGKSEEDSKTKRRKLNLDAWKNVSVDEDSIFGEDDGEKRIEDQEGDALFAMSYDLCVAQMPECSSNFSMLGSLYRQRVRSDCTAFENSLKQKQTESQQKLAAAEAAMREAALEQYKSANKYDLGQCTIQFKQCMQTTAGCGEDFTGCAGLAAAEEAVTKKNTKSKKAKQTTIQGTVSSITIAAATFDTLESKKPLCMDVTKNCVNVRDQVWNTFLREVAPELKSAELLAESNLRTSCIGNIAQCFQKACKDNIDPNDEEGSYDMCLSRPETVESLCKVEIQPCVAAEPKIMDYVRAKLASMRVDACTKEVKDCLQDENRCGKDYAGCIGLDTDTIVRLCPPEKLTACYQEYGGKKSTVDDALTRMVDGIFLNIDNSILDQCQKLAQNKVIEICGSLSETECQAFSSDDSIGTDSLLSYKDNNGNITIDGLLDFNALTSKETSSAKNGILYTVDADAYLQKINQSGAEFATQERIKAAINGVKNKIDQRIKLLNMDPKISMCINGRDTSQLSRNSQKASSNLAENGRTNARFPHLLDSYQLMILNAGISQANKNYSKKKDSLVADAIESRSDDEKAAICAAMAINEGAAVCKEYKADDGGNAVCTNYEPKAPLSNLFVDSDQQIGLDASGTKMVIQGADLEKKLTAITNGKGEFIQTDKDGNMVGRINMTAAYSADNNICKIVTETIMCKNIEAILTDVKKLKTKDENGNKIKKKKYKEYQGSQCTEFADPMISSDEIRL